MNDIKYNGPLSIEWEDSAMDRVAGASESQDYARKIDFEPSAIAFDSSFSE